VNVATFPNEKVAARWLNLRRTLARAGFGVRKAKNGFPRLSLHILQRPVRYRLTGAQAVVEHKARMIIDVFEKSSNLENARVNSERIKAYHLTFLKQSVIYR